MTHAHYFLKHRYFIGEKVFIIDIHPWASEKVLRSYTPIRYYLHGLMSPLSFLLMIVVLLIKMFNA